MRVVNVEWSPAFEVGEIQWKGWSDWCLYMMVWTRRDLRKRMRLAYIGQAYSQHVAERMVNHHRLGEFVDETPIGFIPRIRLGRLCLAPGRRISKRLVSDVEATLIFDTEPPLNVQGKANFLSGRGIQINNSGGYQPLKRRISWA